MITIYKSDGTIRTTQHESPDSYFNPKISDEENAQINFEIGEYINFEVGDYILLYGFYLTLYSIPTPLKKSSNNRYSYQLKFESPRYGMSKVNLLLFDNTTSLQTPDYNPLATYSKGNVVKYHTLYWECVSDSPITGITPEEGQYWQLKSNVTHEVPEYNPATTYTSGDEVTYNLCIWKHIGAVDTVGVHPEEGDSWTQITTAPDFDFSAVLTPRRWAQLFCDNMNRARPKENWSVGYTISDQPKEQAFTNAYVLDALGGTAELYNTEFWIGQLSHNNYTINIGKKSNQTSLVMKYGGGNGFKNIERDEVTENNKITRLVALGGTSNIPSTYRGGSKRLMLPNSYYLDADNIDLNNPLEGTMTWDDIYPCMLHATDDWNASTAYAIGEMVVYNNISWTCLVGNTNQTPSEGTYWQISEGTVTTAVSQYKLIDKNLTFNPLDPNLIMHDGTVPKVHFITGNLAGYEFPIAGYNKDTKQITIQQIQDANDSYLPTAGYTFSENDQFNIVDFYMPSEYISKAENLLKAKATEWLNQYSKDQVSYKGEVDTVWATDGKVELNCGDVIEVIDTDFGIDLPYRITDLKRYITEPYKYEIVLDDTPYVPTKLSSMKNEIVKNSTYIQYNNLDTQMAKTRTYKGAAEAINMAFDPTGNYFTNGIAPLFVKSAMALFGTETQQYKLTGINMTTNPSTPNVVSWNSGTITDYTQQDTARTWNITSGSFTATDNNTPYYCYIKCITNAGNTSAEIFFSEKPYKVNEDSGFYYFLFGTLTELYSGSNIRQFYTSYGYTYINGGNVVTGKIQSSNGSVYIDLDNGVIHFGGTSDNYFEYSAVTGKFTIKDLLLAQEAYIDNLYVSKLSTSTNPYNFLLSILDSSLGIFRNKADSNDISKAMVGLGKDISIMQASGERKPALKVEDTQWKGDYSATIIYYKDDRVYHSDGNTYIFTHEWLETETPVAGILPTNSAYWEYLGSGNLGGGSYSEVGCDGIFSNGSNIKGISGILGILSNFSEAMLLQKRNSDSNGVSAAIYGIDQTSDSDNINASRSYGGMFNRLFIQSELDNITTTSSTDNLTLSKKSNHTIHYHGSGVKNIYLPTVNYRDVGLKFVICNVNENGTLLINGNGTSVINIGNWTAGQKWKATCVYDGAYWVITYVHD